MIDPSNPEAANAAFSKLSLMAMARANLYRLLADAFANPDQEFVEQILSGAYVSELHGYFSDLAAYYRTGVEALDPLKDCQASLSGTDPQALLKEMKVEYARLFIGPGTPVVQPYETFYNQRMTSESQPLLMVSPAAIKVETVYREAGVAMSQNEPPDHFAVELEFLYFISRKESDAWAEGDNAAGNQWHRAQLVFLDGHLGVWGPQFCSQVEQVSSHPFYRSIAHFAGVLFKMEGSNPPNPAQ